MQLTKKYFNGKENFGSFLFPFFPFLFIIIIQLFLTPSRQQDPAPTEDPAPAAEPSEPAAEAPAEEAKPVSPPDLSIHSFHPCLTLH